MCYHMGDCRMSAIDWKAKRGTCPQCNRVGALGIGKVKRSDSPSHGKVSAHCFGCGYTAWPDQQQAHEASAAHSSEQRHETLSEYGHRLWNECRPIDGDGRAYLLARRCVIPPADGDLRYHPALKHSPSGQMWPALVALVTDVVTREWLSLHRTWVRSDGRKAPVDPPRMQLRGHRKAGGVVRLWSDEAVTHGLGIAEGLESALSLAHAVRPVWSCIDAGNLATLPVLGGIECLTIGADNDDAGLSASRACANRWARAGVDVRVVLPEAKRADVNDLVAA